MSARAAKKVYRAVVGPAAVDQVRAWPGTADETLPMLRYLHIGDCNFRRMDHAHDTAAGPGYPLEAAHVLLRHGVGVEFSHYFSVNFEHLPTRDELLRRMRLSGPPDVISLHIGGNYTRWIVMPDTVRTMQLRVELGRRLSRHSGRGYRAIRPFVRHFGRPAARYNGTHAYEDFIQMLGEVWPDAYVIVVTPFPRLKPYPRQGPIGEQVDADIRDVAERRGAALVDTAALLGRDPQFRGTSGYHLNGRGGKVVGQDLARLILQRQKARPAPQRSANLVKALAATLRLV
jgi:GDSL-like Lipase/Acylhydrolase family